MWDEPMASFTKLGWVVHGKTSKCRKGPNFMCAAFENNKDDELHQLVKEQFRLESLGIKIVEKLPRSNDDTRAEMMMDNLTYRDEEGRLVVPMLWRTDDLNLPESKSAARRRLTICEK
jgi:hypothetical protein